MQPTISRETVLVDRRQPSLRWSAVFAGTACSIGLWILLQLLGMGIGLSAVDADSVRSLRGAGIGTTVWALVAPLIAMFFGGVIAGKLAQTYDRKLAGVHGLVMWSITSIVGLLATVGVVTMIAHGAGRHGGAFDTAAPTMSWGDHGSRATMSELGVDPESLLAPINQRLTSQGKPAITVEQFEASMRGVVRDGMARGNFDQELLVDQLVANTRLSRADATEVEREIEARVDSTDTRAHALERRAQRYALEAVDATGKALTSVGLSLLLSLITSVLGAILALHRFRRKEQGSRPRGRTTEPGFPAPSEPVTPAPPYPTPTSGPASPIAPPTD